MLTEDTIPKLLLRNANKFGERDAIREKAFGVWETYTWKDYKREVSRLALGLASMGFKRGDKLAVIGENRPRLYFAMIAAQSLGGISVGLYQDSIAKELSFVISHAEVRFVVAENEEQVDKLLEVRKAIKKVERVFFDDPRGLALKDEPWLCDLVDLAKAGDEYAGSHATFFEDEIGKGTGDEVAILSYTSGTTGDPKGVMLTHGNLLSGFKKAVDVEGWTNEDEMLAYLPMAWIGDFAFTVVGGFYAGMTVNCLESPETYRRDFREIGPSLFLGAPRQWENTGTAIQVRMEEADWPKKALYRYFMGVALQVEKMKQNREAVPLGLRIKNAIGEVLVRAPLRDVMGARNVRIAYSGGAPLGEDLMNFFRSMGVNLKQLYALTESSAVCTIQPDGEASSETMGKPLPGIDVKIADNGEILIRGENVFKGYYKNDKATKSTLDKEGWLASGDAGFIDKNGHLKVIDRAKDVSRLNDGTLFAPQFLENKLKFSPYIREAVTLGSGKDFVTAMVNIDLESLENWAERMALTYSGYQDLSQKPEVYQLIHDEIVRTNADLASDSELRGAQVKRFLILNKELDPDDGEITRTRKIRRGVIADRYGILIDALYTDKQQIETDIVVTYEDGHTGSIHSNLQIWDVGQQAAAGAPNARKSA